VHHDVAQVALHVAARREPQRAVVVGDPFGVDQQHVAHAYAPQHGPVATAGGETEVLPRHLHHERYGTVAHHGIGPRMDDAREVAGPWCCEAFPLNGPMTGERHDDRGEPAGGDTDSRHVALRLSDDVRHRECTDEPPRDRRTSGSNDDSQPLDPSDHVVRASRNFASDSRRQRSDQRHCNHRTLRCHGP